MGAVLGLLTGVLQVMASSPASALVLPPGFQLVDYPTGQAPYNLTNFAWLDNGGLLTSGKDGTITFVPPGGTPSVLTTVPSVRAVGDHGLLGFDLANDYVTSGHVYISYDKGDPDGTGFGMVEEWTAFPPANPTSFTHSRTVIDGSRTSPQFAQTGPTHGIDSLVVAPDDTLFLSIGDDAPNGGDPRSLRAQDLDQPYGKLLHLTADGEGVPSNPYYSSTAPASWRSMVFAYGLRNPFRFALDPRSGIPHLGDVGAGRFEEINTLAPGANAGWPCYEGREPTTFSSHPVCEALYESGSAHMPIVTYPRAGQGASVVGGVTYTGGSYPAKYRNSYFYGDYSREQLWTLATDTAGNLTRAPEVGGFATEAGGPVAFHTGPNGDVTYADLLNGTVRRLVYAVGNRPPVAQFTSTTDAASRTVTFSAHDSYDLDGDELTYRWQFGDGTPDGSGETVDHTYSNDGAVEVTLTVTDPREGTDSVTSTVHPTNHTPQLTVVAPPPARTYAVGDMVELAATATDQEDGPLTVSWHMALRHCPFAGSCHLHPDSTVTGPSYSHSFTDHGADTDMLVTVRAEDSKGAIVSETYVAKPTVRTLAVNSPVAVNINDSTAASAQVVAGSTVQVNAPSTPYWEFESWSDDGDAAHSFTMPDADLTLTAQYRSALAKYAALGAVSSFLGTPTSAEYDVAGGRARNYTGGRVYWSAISGAHAVRGAIVAKYLSVGGPAVLGFPTTDELAVPGGRASDFTKARIYWSPGNGTHVIRGPILAKYLAAGGAAEYGLPQTDTTRIGRGRYAHFTGGRSIFWSSATGAHLVYGPIRRKYASMGYQQSCLGYPTTDELSVTGGRRSRFVHGTITYTSRTGTTTAKCSTSKRG